MDTRTQLHQNQGIHVLIVDDHPIVSSGLANLIQGQSGFAKCSLVTSAAATVDALRTSYPDLIVVDIGLPEIGGLELIKQIKSRWRRLKVLAWSAQEEELYAERALRAGASGFITKEAAPEAMIAAIKKVLAGNIALSPRMNTRMLDRALSQHGSASMALIARFSDRELEIFGMIGDGRGTAEIADALCLSRKTVESHREHVKAKLNLKLGPELVMAAIQWKYDQETVSR